MGEAIISAAGPAVVTKSVGKIMSADGRWHDFQYDFRGETFEHAEECYRDWQQQCCGYDISFPLGVLMEKYIYEILIPDNSIRYNTKIEYIQAYKKYIKGMPFLTKPLCSIRPIDLQLEYNSMSCSKRNIMVFNNLLSRLYSFLRLRMDISDITKNVKVPKDEKNPRAEVEIWSEDELRAIISGLPDAPRIRFLIVVLMNTGCRISEALALKYTDIQRGMMKIDKQLIKYKDLHGEDRQCHYRLGPPKSVNSFRTIPLNEYVLSELEIHKTWHKNQMDRLGYKTDFLFTTRTGHFIDKRSEMRTFNRFYDRIGVPHRSYHVYRHTFATNLCRQNVPLQVAADLLGHSSVNITAKYYINIDNEQKIDAINKISPQL